MKEVETKNEVMNHNTRNTYAAYGLEILKHAVLLLLYQTSSQEE